jgi:hypothetical protein
MCGRMHDQARPAAIALLALGLGACSGGVPRDIDPRVAIGNLFGRHLEGREPPPGLDQPYPNLASVPARPVPPDAATRAALSASLAEDRTRSRAELLPGAGPAAPAVPEGGPPAPPRLAAVPPVRVAPAAPPAAPAPGGTAAPAPAAAPGFAAPPPPPAGDLLAPPPPSADLLAPRPN